MPAAISARPNWPRASDQRCGDAMAPNSPRAARLASCALGGASGVGAAYHLRLPGDVLGRLVAAASGGGAALVLGDGGTGLDLGGGDAVHLTAAPADTATEYVVQRAPGIACFAGTCVGRLAAAAGGPLASSRPIFAAARRAVVSLGSESFAAQKHVSPIPRHGRTAGRQRASKAYESRTVIRRGSRDLSHMSSARSQDTPARGVRESRFAESGLCESSHSMSPLHDVPCEPILGASDRGRLVEELGKRFREYKAHDAWIDARLAVFRDLRAQLVDPQASEDDSAHAIFRVTVEQRRLLADAEYSRRLALLEGAYADVLLLRRRLAG